VAADLAVSFVEAVVATAFDVDNLCPSLDAPLDRELGLALEAFWSESDHTETARDLGLPWATWRDTSRAMGELLKRAPTLGEADRWRKIVRDAEPLRTEHPVAAVLVTLMATARWCGGRGPDVFVPLPHGEPDPDWELVALPLAQRFVAAGAHWAAHYVSRKALGTLESMPAHWQRREASELHDAFTAILRELEKSYEGVLNDARWALAERAAVDAATRAAFAAVLWAMGDVVRALALVGDRLRLTPGNAGFALRQAMVRGPRDVLLRRTWWEAHKRGAIDLSRWRILLGPIGTGHFRTASSFEELVAIALGISAARVHAHVILGHFSGDLRSDDRAALSQILEFGKHCLPSESRAFVRMASLQLLVDRQHRQPRPWQRLARLAAEAIETERWSATADPFDRSLDVPLSFLSPADPATFELLEDHRCASLAYWLVASRPALPHAPAAQALLEREDELLEEVRGARLVSLLSLLPKHYQYATSPDDSDLAAPWWDKQQAIDRLASLRAELRTLHDELRDVAPVYAHARLEPRASLDGLRAALAP
jgi:hypothetical protein